MDNDPGMTADRRRIMSARLVLLVQLPIPPIGPGAVEGNVPLAAACLKLFARRQGLEKRYSIELLPAALANTLGDQGLDRDDPCAAALDGRLYLLCVERRANALDCPTAEAEAAGIDCAVGRAGNHGRQRLGARQSGGRLRGVGRGRADVRPIAGGALRGRPRRDADWARWDGGCTAIPRRVRKCNGRTNGTPSP